MRNDIEALFDEYVEQTELENIASQARSEAAKKRAITVVKLYEKTGKSLNELSVYLGVSKQRAQQLAAKGKEYIKDE